MKLGKHGTTCLEFFCWFSLCLSSSCVTQDFDDKIDSAKIKKATAQLPSSSASVPEQSGMCPDGTRFNSFPRVCVTRGGFALGPFPLELQELCRQMSPDDASTCVQKQDWPFELLMSLVSSYKLGCPPGTSPGQGGVCVGPDNIYGPFTLQQIMACRATVPSAQQKQCDEIVWPPDFLKFANESAPEQKKTELKESSTNVDSLPQTQPLPQPPAKAEIPAKAETPTKAETPAKAETPTKAEIPTKTIEEAPKAPTFCVYTWDEVPGTADFTTVDLRSKSLRMTQNYPLDRTQESTLLGSRDFQSLDMCGRARFLKGCFQKVVFDNNSPASQTFRAWALGRVRPLEAHMAFVMNQTRLGLWHDECWRGRCKGIGISRVTTARTVTGKRVANEDIVWRGITHNIVTNLRFGLRQIAAKAAEGPSDLYQLAYSFKGSPGKQERFAQVVDKYYRQLVACQLD